MEGSDSAEPLARRIVGLLQGAGHVAYYAGGCVRDRVMGREPADFDVATGALPEQVLKLFPRSQQVGIAFGVVLVRGKGAQYKHTVEVATFRAEGKYMDGRHPEQVTFTNAEADAKRRDFTCNGLFFDPIAEKLLDYVGGVKDIEARVLRAIGEPELRFGEDHLRMLRAVRFAAKLGFAISGETWEAMRRLAGNIGGISRERIGEEMRMMLEHGERGRAVGLLEGSGLLKMIWPAELLGTQGAGGGREWRRVAGLAGEVTRTMGLVAMQRDLGVPAGMRWGDARGVAELLRERFMLSNVETEDIAYVGEKVDVLRGWRGLRVAGFKRLLADPRWEALASLWRAEVGDEGEGAALGARVAELSKGAVAPPPLVTGHDLIEMGARPGKEFRAWLEELYDRQLEGELGDREGALEAARGLVRGAGAKDKG